MHPKNLLIKDFTYNLPENRIAKYPLAERDGSKLLVASNGGFECSTYGNLHTFLPPDTLLIFNNTRVVEARLLFQKETGGIIEIFCLEPSNKYADITTAMQQKGSVLWKCLVGGAAKWKSGITLKKTVFVEGKQVAIEAVIKERLTDSFIIELSWLPADLTFAEMLHEAGFLPLPPYLHRTVEEDDKDRYQTVYARHDGSVAAPTAGLHFTPQLFDRLALKGIGWQFVTLHVGAGTFKPVKSSVMEDHEMHAEFLDVSLDSIKQLLLPGKTVVAVGTTSLRTIESLFWMGLKVTVNPAAELADIALHQWDAYELQTSITTHDALSHLVSWMENRQLKRLITKTQIMIAPGYKLKIAKGLITNFHQPQSTLLLLIAAITGDKWKEMYEFALDNEFRFLSYGDGCLLWNNEEL